MSTPFYVTTPIYYVNSTPHLGHAYTTIVVDVAQRFHQLLGHDTFFLTGTDEHGDKIVQAAEKAHTSVEEYVDNVSKLFEELWPQLDIHPSYFIRTTHMAHKKIVQKVLQQLFDQGDIYYSEYEGLYCTGCERFYIERELQDGKCPDHLTEPKRIKESNYFFKMSQYQTWLIDYIEKNPTFIQPQRYRNEVLSFLKEPLADLCISRPTSRLTWGIPLPFDSNYVTYVWFDALLNYLSAIEYPDSDSYKKYWPACHHITAKDILKPHGIYWPTMLKAMGLEPYRHLYVHGYWNVADQKMSKSLGNGTHPLKLKEKYGTDGFRFFMMREMSFGLDANFSEEALVNRMNTDLTNDLGNMVSRTLAMTHKYCNGAVPAADDSLLPKLSYNLALAANEMLKSYTEYMDTFQFHRALESVWELLGRMNRFVDTMAPWALAKDESQTPLLHTVLRHLLETLVQISVVIWPVMPATAQKIQYTLGFSNNTFLTLGDVQTWPLLATDTSLGKAPMLFPRIDASQIVSVPTMEETLPPAPSFKPEIEWDDLQKIDLRVATIVNAEKIPKANKLLKLEIDCGEKRTVVAGIAKAYAPEDLIGKKVIVVANLKPTKLMGITSEAMVLAAVGEDTFALTTVNNPDSPAGTPIS